jgi:hypothetical protein
VLVVDRHPCGVHKGHEARVHVAAVEVRAPDIARVPDPVDVLAIDRHDVYGVAARIGSADSDEALVDVVGLPSIVPRPIVLGDKLAQ